MKFIDFILGRISSNTPDFLVGTKDTKTVKVPFNSVGAIKLLGSKIGFNMNSTADQLITLSGGTKFIITDVVIRNVIPLNSSAANLQIWDGVNRSGNQFYTTSIFKNLLNNTTHVLTQIGVELLDYLSIPGQYINKDIPNAGASGGNNKTLGYSSCLTNLVEAGSTLYASLGAPQGVAGTGDIYIYGYVIA